MIVEVETNMTFQKRYVTHFVIAIAFVLTILSSQAAQAAQGAGDQHPAAPRAVERIQREVRNQLVMLPYYGVFDNLTYSVDGYNVTLSGQVTRPTLKSDAEKTVKQIEGVEKITNNIEVLPISQADDRIRLATYRAVYGQGALERYAIQAVPPIHIIVKNGRVTLEGVVANQADKTMADLKAKGVSGVFSVTNNLRTEK
jgi:hyperosmotically inducible protein